PAAEQPSAPASTEPRPIVPNPLTQTRVQYLRAVRSAPGSLGSPQASDDPPGDRPDALAALAAAAPDDEDGRADTPLLGFLEQLAVRRAPLQPAFPLRARAAARPHRRAGCAGPPFEHAGTGAQGRVLRRVRSAAAIRRRSAAARAQQDARVALRPCLETGGETGCGGRGRPRARRAREASELR